MRNILPRSLGGSTYRARLRYCPVFGSSFEYTRNVVLEPAIPLSYSVSLVVTTKDAAELRIRSPAARISPPRASTAPAAMDLGGTHWYVVRTRARIITLAPQEPAHFPCSDMSQCVHDGHLARTASRKYRRN